ncbi:MAG: hypothetical protein HC916_05105 [Coleofasciculaceae cyanobacterium SM2_1_6]|nr:hypothetical protein [Coleofasciculaceae cyanobacterium SM2_1_6]
MDLKQIAKETAKVLTSYLTYQALKLVLAQVTETNPPLAIWLTEFSATHSIQDGEAYLEALLQVESETALRIMTVRQHLADEVTEFLPEMVQANIQKSNMIHRRQHLEKLSGLVPSALSPDLVQDLDSDLPTDLSTDLSSEPSAE